MIIDSSLHTQLATLGFPPKLCEDSIVPALEVPPTHCTYRPEYAWQFAYERRLLRRHRAELGDDRPQLIGGCGLLSEVLSNAYAHGNRRDPSLPITLELYAGDAGYLLRVAHSGPGFDVLDTLTRFRDKQCYFSVAGNGLRRLDSSLEFEVFFASDGRAVHLVRRPH